MPVSRRGLLTSAAALSAAPLLYARAQSKPTIKLGVLTDLGGTYRDNTGPTTVACARQAIEEFNPSAHGFEVDLRVADHQNKPDVAASIARQWYDGGVLAAIDVPTSSVALAVAQVAKEKDKVMLNASATTTDLTDGQCSPNSIVWSFDTYENASSTGGAMVRAGQKSWFFITADYVFGHILEAQNMALVKKAGGEVKGAVRYPFPDTTDFSSYITQALASGATTLGLANAGLDTQNCVKQAHEFGLQNKMKIVPLLLFSTDAHALGLEMAQGLVTTETFYWDLNPGTRAFTRRVLPRTPNNYPNQAHASGYAITLHYLKAVAAMGAAKAMQSGRQTVAQMKSMPTHDDAFGKGSIRADGRGVFPAYLFEVKKPSESKGPWDLYKLLHTSAPADVLHPLNTKCMFPTKA
ncbi:MAG TPA: ABC transporter substrate-binding protein [Acetobacteraceae bacterium]|jgi:branched-chain amino acid transport system substrate-binding protein